MRDRVGEKSDDGGRSMEGGWVKVELTRNGAVTGMNRGSEKEGKRKK